MSKKWAGNAREGVKGFQKTTPKIVAPSDPSSSSIRSARCPRCGVMPSGTLALKEHIEKCGTNLTGASLGTSSTDSESLNNTYSSFQNIVASREQLNLESRPIIQAGGKISPDASPQALTNLAKSDNPRMRAHVACHANTPVAVLDALSSDESLSVRSGVAYNKQSSPGALEKLAEDESVRVRSNVAENPSTSPRVLESLATTSNHEILSALAKNPSAPEHILDDLAKRGDSIVVENVVRNRGTSRKTLEYVCRYGDPKITQYVAIHPNTSDEFLKKLSIHSNSNVARQAQRTLERRMGMTL